MRRILWCVSVASASIILLAAAVFTFVPFATQAQEQPRASALPAGARKSIAEGVCTLCHQTNMITQSSGYTREGWPGR